VAGSRCFGLNDASNFTTCYVGRMKPNARLTDILHTLADPIEYVRGIVGSFVQYQFDKTTSIVRIGISGAGIVPNYSIETPCEPATELPGGPQITRYISERRVFNGRNHKEFGDDSPISENWSSEGMTFSEVQALLGRLRESKRRRH
jgi:hypothetical protein